MDTDRLKELAPHYIAMFILVLLVLEIVRRVMGELGFWPELAIIILVVFAYRPVVMKLGVGPSRWE